MKEQKSAIEELKVIVEGRTRYEGQEPDLLDRLYDEVIILHKDKRRLDWFEHNVPDGWEINTPYPVRESIDKDILESSTIPTL